MWRAGIIRAHLGSRRIKPAVPERRSTKCWPRCRRKKRGSDMVAVLIVGAHAGTVRGRGDDRPTGLGLNGTRPRIDKPQSGPAARTSGTFPEALRSPAIQTRLGTIIIGVVKLTAKLLVVLHPAGKRAERSRVRPVKLWQTWERPSLWRPLGFLRSTACLWLRGHRRVQGTSERPPKGARSEALVNHFESGEPAPKVLSRALELLGPASAL